jgi:hypothetical protein
MCQELRFSRFFILNCLMLNCALLTSCGGSGIDPSKNAPRLTSITPASGTTLGGTAVTITGTNLTASATVTIGGSPATDVTFVSSTSLSARTPQHSAGTADVVVSVGAQRGILAQGYRFVAPAIEVNQPPVVSSLAAKGAALREPAQYATLGETLTVTAAVTDAETAIDQLTFAWSSDVGGTFTGTGTKVTWTAPSDLPNTPRTATLTLVVTERFSTTDTLGLPTTGENRVSTTSLVRVHNSPKEVGDLAVQFLVDFSRQIDPVQVMRNFSTFCAEAAAELIEVRDNQRQYLITSYTVGQPVTSVTFAGKCPFRNVTGDACAVVPVEWFSTVKASGRAIWTRGFDQVTALLENDQWKLCGSDYDQVAASPLLQELGLRFKR